MKINILLFVFLTFTMHLHSQISQIPDTIIVYDTVIVFDTIIVYDTIHVEKNKIQQNKDNNYVLCLDSIKNTDQIIFVIKKDSATFLINDILHSETLKQNTMKNKLLTSMGIILLNNVISQTIDSTMLKNNLSIGAAVMFNGESFTPELGGLNFRYRQAINSKLKLGIKNQTSFSNGKGFFINPVGFSYYRIMRNLRNNLELYTEMGIGYHYFQSNKSEIDSKGTYQLKYVAKGVSVNATLGADIKFKSRGSFFIEFSCDILGGADHGLISYSDSYQDTRKAGTIKSYGSVTPSLKNGFIVGVPISGSLGYTFNF